MTQQIQIGSTEIAVIAIIFFTLIALVIFLLIRLNKKIDEVGKPRFGFLGKTLTYSVFAVVIGIGAVAYINYNWVNNNTENRINADNRYTVNFQSYILNTINQNDKKLQLSGIVMEGDTLWGNNNYDFTWSFIGTYNTVKPITELKRGKDTPSYLEVELPKDLYSVTLKAVNGTTVISETKEIDLR